MKLRSLVLFSLIALLFFIPVVSSPERGPVFDVTGGNEKNPTESVYLVGGGTNAPLVPLDPPPICRVCSFNGTRVFTPLMGTDVTNLRDTLLDPDNFGEFGTVEVDIEFAPTVSGTVLVRDQHAHGHKTTNGGDTWVRFPTELHIMVIDWALHPVDPDTIYLADPLEGVFRTTDGGVTWEVAKEVKLTQFDCALGEHGGQPSLIFTVGLENPTQQPLRYRVNIFLDDMDKAAGHLVPRKSKGKPPVVEPGKGESVKIPFIGTDIESKKILVIVKTISVE